MRHEIRAFPGLKDETWGTHLSKLVSGTAALRFPVVGNFAIEPVFAIFFPFLFEPVFPFFALLAAVAHGLMLLDPV